MAITVKHKFQSLVGDGPDTTVIRPSNWNDTHSIQMAANKLLGRLTAGTGDAEEISFTSFGASLFSAADVAALAAIIGIHTTGDFKLTIKSAADTGWVMCNDGTIGPAGSAATARANSDTWALYSLLYSLPDAYAPVTGGRSGAGAAADYASLKPIGLTKMLGRALCVAGTGSGLSTRPLGVYLGEETTTIATANLPPYTPTGSISNTLSITLNDATSLISGTSGGYGPFPAGSGSVVQTVRNPYLSYSLSSTFNGTPQGGLNTPINTMQPSSFVNVMIKL